MSEKVMIRLSEATERASVDQLKYWCKLLEIKPKVISRAAHVTKEQAEILREMASLVEDGKKPKEAAESLSCRAVTASPIVENTTNKILQERLGSMEKAIMLLVDQNQKLAKTVEAQNQKIEKLTLRLAPPVTETKQIKAWQPPKKQAPKLNFWQKLWYEITDPIKLRAI